jgi:hypothetical protein
MIENTGKLSLFDIYIGIPPNTAGTAMDESKDEPFTFTPAEGGAAAPEPATTHFIDPPFQIKVEGSVMHVDAPCWVAGNPMKPEVLRFSFSAAAAMVIKEALNMITFVEAPGNPTQ